MAFITEAAMSFIYEGMVDTDWPGGLAYLVVRAIKKKHMPDDMVSKVELRRQLNGIIVKKGDDPVVLGTQIASIKVRFNKPGQTIDETEFTAVVIAQAAVIYTGVLRSEQLRHGNALRLHHLFSAMDMQWYAMGGGNKNKAERSRSYCFKVCASYATRRGVGHMNVPARKRTGMVTVITAKEFARTRVEKVLIVDFATSPTTLNSSAGENPITSISSLIGSRRRNKRTLWLMKERHRNYSYAAWKSAQN
jgi:hypothetical protein